MSQTEQKRPHSLKAEKRVLQGTIGEASTGNEALADHVVTQLSDRSFYEPKHKKIFNAIIECVAKAKRPDYENVYVELEKHEAPGLLRYLTNIVAESYVGPDSVRGNIPTLHWYQKKRRHKRLAKALDRSADDLDRDPDDVALEAESELIRPVTDGQFIDGTTLGATYGKFRHEMQKASESGGIAGLSTGFKKIDHATNGFKEGDYILIMADTSIGKTSLALDIATHLTIHQNIPGLYIAVEMSPVQLTQRVMSPLLKINLQNMIRGQLTSSEWEMVDQMEEEINKTPLHIVPFAGKDQSALQMTIRKYFRFFDVEYVVVDYIQKIRGRGQSREERLDDVSTTIQHTAADLGIPIIALSQLTFHGDGEKIPAIENIRYSRTPGHDADIVMGIYRPEAYGLLQDDMGRDTRGYAQLHMVKQRQGEKNLVLNMGFVDRFAMFTNETPFHTGSA